MDIVKENEVLKEKIESNPKIRELTPLEKQQLEFLVKEYPMLDSYMIETILRLPNSKRDEICEEIRSGELKLKDDKPQEEIVLKSVSLDEPKITEEE